MAVQPSSYLRVCLVTDPCASVIRSTRREQSVSLCGSLSPSDTPEQNSTSVDNGKRDVDNNPTSAPREGREVMQEVTPELNLSEAAEETADHAIVWETPAALQSEELGKANLAT